ncbi:tRNA (N6-threonylcarbamoyladenosine(37)-N6)-methyltransferase TrmO [Tropicibacter oceani]|uniref:tRNA (N6-threonylcarbamoyladenosine(37)-N6)-methyltransferase TrmO n=1 Tax=Tropicibacter oceani TaxID=3058420 RepID=A0ABY8QG10_9RHOB|nr:tRNA (N6-threonylcarbamoyladenosine(37)-N6)-methyltransferase TrmO [Tropicibacter oceani]WGW03547.1 tRNA (N6-threonylcarbamoyladenosine(37)-N6)-methyltransferase TrmO [Tropicibacter oceani]
MTHHGDALRSGETALKAQLPENAGLSFVGVIHTPFKTRDDCPRQGDMEGPDCTIELDPRLEPALEGIERFETLEILYWLHKARRDLLTQSPRSDGAVRGTFALRSPLRPNPIGTSRVRLVARTGNVLTVRGLDCLDGTPLLDIKPDRCGYTVQAPPKPAG